MNVIAPLLEFLNAELKRGRRHVGLDEEAKDSLRRIFKATRQQGAPAAAPSPGTRLTRELPETAPSSHIDPAPAAGLVPSLEECRTGTPDQQLACLKRTTESWPPALALGTLRDIPVFSSGVPEARIMMIGEAPGYHEERKREPFIGPAGQMLDKIIIAMGLARDDVYLTNVVKFRPAMERQSTNNRKPNAAEIAASLPILLEEIRIVAPDCIILLGQTAVEGLLNEQRSIPELRGDWLRFGEIPVRASYHPSYLLQTGADQSVKRSTWEDMLAVMHLLEMPISPRQQKFFLPK